MPVQKNQIVVITQLLTLTGVTAAEVCTDASKAIIKKSIVEVLNIDGSFVDISKCEDKSRRSRRLLSNGVELEYKVSLPKTEASPLKQTAVVDAMIALAGNGAAATTVLTAVSEAAGKDISAVTMEAAPASVKIEEAM